MKNENKPQLIEKFSSIDPNEDGSFGMSGLEKTSFTKAGFCMGADAAGRGDGNLSGGGVRPKRKGEVGIIPNKDQMSSEFSKWNPIWMIFPVLNLVIDILMMVFEVWKFLFEIIFFKTYEIMVPGDFNFGLRSGKKYCYNLMPFRMLITFLCPPAGVFMAYGMKGFVQIIICSVLSLLFYVPGLVYGILVILRSDVAEHIEQVELDICADDGSTGLFTSDEEQPKCSAKVGDTCTIKGEPKNNNPMKINCCMQPKYKNGKWYWGDTGDEAMGPRGAITQFAEGELKCVNDFKTNFAPTKGLCVYKSTGGVGHIG
jgi:uncharacterized membrane protein YqaE (UPF0057 family)